MVKSLRRKFNIVNILTDSYYREWLKVLTDKYLYSSRQEDLYKDPKNILFLEFKIVEPISNIEKAIKEFKEKNKINQTSD